MLGDETGAVSIGIASISSQPTFHRSVPGDEIGAVSIGSAPMSSEHTFHRIVAPPVTPPSLGMIVNRTSPWSSLPFSFQYCLTSGTRHKYLSFFGVNTASGIEANVVNTVSGIETNVLAPFSFLDPACFLISFYP
jgi:hypothetical protein